MAKKGNAIELGTQPIGKLLMQYAIPAIIAMTASSLYNMVDSIFIGQGVGPLAISGLAITFPFMNLGAAINIGVDIYRFTFDICYSMGLTNAIKGGVVLNSNIHPGERHNADTDRLNTFSITLGYRFGK